MSTNSESNPEAKITIDIWSDVVCPFCYLGDTILDSALSKFEHADAVEIRYHSFQLMPEIEPGEAVNLVEHLSKKYGGPEAVEQMNAQIVSRGNQYGIDYRFDKAITVNTLKAHRLLHFAAEKGVQHSAVMALFRAYFTEGKNVADTDTLVDLLQPLGLGADEIREVADGDRYAELVQADIAAAREIGIQGVPFFVFQEKYGISGAQPEEMFSQALETVWAELD